MQSLVVGSRIESKLCISARRSSVEGEKKTLKVEQGATRTNGQDDQVSGDVTTRLDSDWTVVTGHTRTQKKELMTTTPVKTGTKPERKNESRAHSFV